MNFRKMTFEQLVAEAVACIEQARIEGGKDAMHREIYRWLSNAIGWKMTVMEKERNDHD